MVESFPDTRSRSDRNAGSAGDVPVLLLNSTLLKDDVIGKVWRTEDGPGRFHFPDWLPTSFYDELTAETRNERRWEDHGRPNESFDLSCYAEAAALFMKADRIDWSAPPSWAAEWDKNPDVCRPGDEPGRPNDTQITRRKSNYW